MKTDRKFIIILSSLLLLFFLIALICLANSNSENFLRSVFVIQLLVFSIAMGAVIVYYAWPYFNKISNVGLDITKIVLLSETNVLLDEFSLVNRACALIGKSGKVYLSADNDLTGDECAVLNCVEKDWYIERVQDKFSVGLKRAKEQYVCKLKAGMCYRLQANDIIYIGDERLLLL